MQSKWSDDDFSSFHASYSAQGIQEDLIACMYASRLIGSEPKLVLHGSGNTSVKSQSQSLLNDAQETLFVKASGLEMAHIEPGGFPAVSLKGVCQLDNFSELTDDAMMKYLRSQLIDPSMMTPSIETVMHALIPYKFVFRCHSNAILSLVNQTNAQKLCEKIFGDEVSIVPFQKPGFSLAKTCAKALKSNRQAQAIILMNQGLITFSHTAKAAYESMIQLVDQAETFISEQPSLTPSKRSRSENKKLEGQGDPAGVAPLLRGLLQLGTDDLPIPRIMRHRVSEDILDYINTSLITDVAQRGCVHPDHIKHTKRYPLVLPSPLEVTEDEFALAANEAIKAYESDYRAYVACHQSRLAPGVKTRDPKPYVVYVQDIGLFGVGQTAKEADVIADVAQMTIDVIRNAERVGRFVPLNAQESFDFEYWPLDKLKLDNLPKEDVMTHDLMGHVVVITGALSSIGRTTALAFKERGAEVVLMDRHGEDLQRLATLVSAYPILVDMMDTDAVNEAFEQVKRMFGGMDILVSHTGKEEAFALSELDNHLLQDSFVQNVCPHQYAAQAAVKQLGVQGYGGCLTFITPRQTISSQQQSGLVSVHQAAINQMMVQYAVEGGQWGIRSNSINVNGQLARADVSADVMFMETCLQDTKGVLSGSAPNNLMSSMVKVEDVANAVVGLTQQRKTTAAAIRVDGGI